MFCMFLAHFIDICLHTSTSRCILSYVLYMCTLVVSSCLCYYYCYYYHVWHMCLHVLLAYVYIKIPAHVYCYMHCIGLHWAYTGGYMLYIVLFTSTITFLLGNGQLPGFVGPFKGPCLAL